VQTKAADASLPLLALPPPSLAPPLLCAAPLASPEARDSPSIWQLALMASAVRRISPAESQRLAPQVAWGFAPLRGMMAKLHEASQADAKMATGIYDM